MEPPPKRPRLVTDNDDDDEENQDELSMSLAQFDAYQDPMYQLDKGRAKAATRLKSAFEDIFDKYGKDFDGDDDVINFYTDEIEVDNGHVQSLESQKDPATDDSLSSDEEGRITSGKTGGQTEEQASQSKSPIVTSHQKHKAKPKPKPPTQFSSPFNSSWNEPLGLGAYRPSPFAFSSPFTTQSPVGFGPPAFGNPSIDPVWQAPELPVQRYSWGAVGSQFGSFGNRSHPVVKRLASAKSFLLPSTSTSSGDYDDAEEDDILLGGDKHDILPISRPSTLGNDHVQATTSNTTKSASQSSGHEPSFLGLDPVGDPARISPGSPRDEMPHDRNLEQQARDGASKSDDGKAQSARGRPRKTSPLCPKMKRGRPKKVSVESPPVHSADFQPECRILQPHQRRIEILIPMMKGLSPTETALEQASEETTLEANKPLPDLHTPQRESVDDSIAVQHLQDELPIRSPAVTPERMEIDRLSPESQDASQDTNKEHSIQELENRENAPGHWDAKESPKRRSKRRKPIKMQTSAKEAQILTIEGSQEPMSSPKMADNPIVEPIINDLDPEDQDPHHGDDSHEVAIDEHSPPVFNGDINEKQGSLAKSSEKGVDLIETLDCATDLVMMGLDEEVSPVSDVSIDKEPTTQVSSFDEGTEPMVVGEQSPDVAWSGSTTLPVTAVRDGPADGEIETSGSTTTETSSFQTAMSEELESLHDALETMSSAEPDTASVGSNEQEAPSISAHGLADETSSPGHQLDEEMRGIWEISPSPSLDTPISTPSKPVVRSSIPRQSEILESTESDPRPADLPPLLSSALVAEIDSLVLNSDRPDTEQSPFLQDIELPDQDLSVFPVEFNTRCTPESASSRHTSPHLSATGRSPSPELGTPIKQRKQSSIGPQARGSPSPSTPTRKRGPKNTKTPSASGSQRRTPSKRVPLSSLVPGDIDDDEESDDELSIAFSFSSAMSRSRSRISSPFSRNNDNNDNTDLPPLFSTPRSTTTRKYGLFAGTPSSSTSTRTPSRLSGSGVGHNHPRGANNKNTTPPATESRVGRGLGSGSGSARRRVQGTNPNQSRAVHSSPLARRVAERLLSSPTKRLRGGTSRTQRSPSLVASPHGTLRRCGEDGFVCDRDFCFTCCK
ncbi:hypothetical protein F4808DRAFT_292933 [Astrocystis sublimbata]|nr:hypothetical protein F4808DRAFT_292933 [Astrocystis sublimbata]